MAILISLLMALLGASILAARLPGGAAWPIPAPAAAVAAGMVILVTALRLALRRRRPSRRSLLAGALLLPGVVVAAHWLSQAAANHGLHAAYFANPEFAGRPFHEGPERTIGTATVEERFLAFPQQDFSILWEGWLWVPRSSLHGLALSARGPASLLIDDRSVLATAGGAKPAETVRWMEAGLHSIVAAYSHHSGLYTMDVLWNTPGAEMKRLSAESLYLSKPSALGFWVEQRGPLWYAGLVTGFGLVRGLVGVMRRRRRGELARGLRSLKARVAALALGAGVALVVAEIGVRVAHGLSESRMSPAEQLAESARRGLGESGPAYSLAGLVRPSRIPGVVFELKPGTTGRFIDRPVRISSQGLRDREYAVPKPPGVFRIVGLGDSVMFGWGVREEDAYPTLLEESLNRAAGERRFEVVNLAVPGYNSAMEAAVLEARAAELEPDLVLVGFIGNDFNLPNFMQARRPLAGLRRLRSLDLALSGWSALVGRYRPEFRGLNLKDLFPASDEEIAADPVIPEEFKSMVGRSGVRRALARLAAVCRERRVPAALAAVGLPAHLLFLEEVCREQAIVYFDLQSALRQEIRARNEDAPNFWVSREDSHPNEAAHRLWAELLEDWLRAEGLIPGPSDAGNTGDGAQMVNPG